MAFQGRIRWPMERACRKNARAVFASTRPCFCVADTNLPNHNCTIHVFWGAMSKSTDPGAKRPLLLGGGRKYQQNTARFIITHWRPGGRTLLNALLPPRSGYGHPRVWCGIGGILARGRMGLSEIPRITRCAKGGRAHRAHRDAPPLAIAVRPPFSPPVVQ